LVLASLAALWMAARRLEEAPPRHKKGYKCLPLEGFLAYWYARNTARDMGEFEKLAQELAGKVKSAGSVIEVAPGPGYLAIALAKLGGYRIVGLDISHSFVQMAAENATKACIGSARTGALPSRR
jgi:2-polyprenyl-3-methyl-5-hydroxy-6-metoxy-1,4-benzoquinol methylase